MKTGRKPFARKHKGFTLIEIAIVLVIIGLLLGGVLQGQQLIENSRVKNAVNSFNGLAAATFSYQDRYGKLPGDDPGAKQTRGDAWPDSGVTSPSNGAIDATREQTFTGGGEVDNFFQNLRSAGFIPGNPADFGAAALPQNPFGGVIGITSEPVNNNLNGLKICMSNVGGASATALDTDLDDGQIATGRFRGTDSGGTLNKAPSEEKEDDNYNEEGIYTICYRM
jgi:prepilin-type N-terminal cleavage/methylation domain-containing protein